MMRISIFLTTVFVVFSLVASQCTAQRSKTKSPTGNKHYVKHTFNAKDGTAINYWLMSPAKIEEGRQYPLVLALHGRGGSTTAAAELGSDKLREQFPCFAMAPASTAEGNWASPTGFGKKKKNIKAMLPAALEALDALIKQHPIDADRVYVTGQSMGGVGSFGALSARPDAFAAAMPVAGGWDPNDADNFKHVAIWVFHGDQDKVVPTRYSRAMVDALKNAGGSPKYTEYKGVGHNSWSQTYASLETWNWLFKQKRKSLDGALDASEPGFERIFNGTNLQGWSGDSKLWSVQDGAITGVTTDEAPLEYNKFLIWDGEVENFHLRAKVRLIGNSNSGIQYRSKHLKDQGEYVVGGYQCDIHPKPENNGMLYHERGRGIVAQHGQKVIVDNSGDKWITGTTGPVQQIKLDDWNTFEIIATGNKLVHKLNGQVCAEIIDHHEAGRLLKGVIAFQVHRGPAMRVQVKDIELKRLPAGGMLSLKEAPIPKNAQKVPTRKPRRAKKAKSKS